MSRDYILVNINLKKFYAVSLTFVDVSVGDVCHGFYDVVDSLHGQVGLLRLLHGLVEQHLLDYK